MIAEVLRSYGADVGSAPFGYKKIRCPFHQDSNPSATVNFDSGKFHCFVCSIHEDSIGIVQREDGLSYAEARKKVEEITGESLCEVRDEPVSCAGLFEQQGNQRRGGNDAQAWRSGLS